MKDKSPLFKRAVTLIKAIPKGRVTTYGKVAELIGAPGCARHVSYILSSSSKKYELPWHRVISSSGKIPRHRNHSTQLKKLSAEGINADNYSIDLEVFLWKPKISDLKKLMKNLPEHKSIYR